MFDRKKYMKEYGKKRYLIKKKEVLIKSKIYRQTHRQEIKERDRKYYLTHKKQCSQHAKEYYQKHREELLQYQKNYREQYPEKIKNRMKKYNDINREINNKKIQEKLKNNIEFKLTHLLRMRIIKVLKGINKSKSTMKLLGCNIDFFKNYYESKFTEGMTWEKVMNGEIHCDHIRPCASFDLSKSNEQHKCFHYTNLQPLWAEDNLRKGAKYGN